MSSSSSRMLVLGLLSQRPMHGYEITQLITQNALDRWTKVLPGSIYHALTKMEAEGLIHTHAEERTGDRLRKIYAISDSGSAVLGDLVGAALARPPHDLRSDLALATVWITLLDPTEARHLLDTARESIKSAQHERAAGRQVKAGLSPLAEALFDNADEVAAADLRLVDRLQDLIA